MVAQDENVKGKWLQVLKMFIIRRDQSASGIGSIPVQRSSGPRRRTLTAVTEARAKATSVQVDPSNLNDESILPIHQQVQDGLSQSIGRLLVSVEAYPDLKANSNFQEITELQLRGY